MANRKKHHYVPKFYLRNFATRLDLPPKERVQIHQFDVKNISWRFAIGLKDQCQKPYLYGKTSELEELLSDFESEFSKIFRGLINGEINNFTEIRIELYIKYFVILSLIRLPRQQSYFEDSLNNLVDQLIEANFPDSKGSIRVSIDNFYHLVIGSLPRFTISLDGTKLVLVRSDGAEFITSDNPVIRHNQIYRQYNETHPCLGFLAKGLQIFIPISPKFMIVLFDEDAYKVKGDIVSCTDDDVKLLNSLQVLNCDSSVYFSSKKAIKSIDLKYARRSERNTGESKFMNLTHATDPLRELSIQQEKRVVPNMPLSFMNPKMLPNINRSSIICPTRRDPRYIERLADYYEEELKKRNRSIK